MGVTYHFAHMKCCMPKYEDVDMKEHGRGQSLQIKRHKEDYLSLHWQHRWGNVLDKTALISSLYCYIQKGGITRGNIKVKLSLPNSYTHQRVGMAFACTTNVCIYITADS